MNLTACKYKFKNIFCIIFVGFLITSGLLLNAQARIKDDCLKLIDEAIPTTNIKLKEKIKSGKDEVETDTIRDQEFWDFRVLPFWNNLNDSPGIRELYLCYARSSAINLAGFVFFNQNDTSINNNWERDFHISSLSPLHPKQLQQTQNNKKVVLLEARALPDEVNSKDLAVKRGGIVKNLLVYKGISPERIKIRVLPGKNFRINKEIAYKYQNNFCNLNKYYVQDTSQVNRSVLIFIY